MSGGAPADGGGTCGASGDVAVEGPVDAAGAGSPGVAAADGAAVDAAAVVVVLGQTGTGKSQLAVELALALDGEVVNVDALQVRPGGPH